MKRYLEKIRGRSDKKRTKVGATRESRAKGAIWGVCVADALGGPVQFMAKGTFEPVRGLETITTYGKPKGSFSDDGSMTLALAQTFIDSQGTYDELTSIRYFLDWMWKGRFSSDSHAWDTGVSTRRALTLWKAGMWEGTTWRDDAQSHMARTQAKVTHYGSKEEASGNGSLMRISPMGVALYRDRAAAREAARSQSGITHPNLACVEACELYTDLLCRVMQGETKEELAGAVSTVKITHETLSARLSKYTKMSDWTKITNNDINSSGWVIDTIEVALWGFFRYDSWKDGALAVVNLGGDSDTAGAVYGGLAGAFYGYEAIPELWINEMQKRELIEETAQGIADLDNQTEATNYDQKLTRAIPK